MYNKVIKYIKDNNLINKDDNVLVALSGGPDSICLLDILYNLKDKLHIKLGAVHINHMLRGEEANEDEAFVKEFCKKLSIPCYTKRIDINKYAKDTKMSSEAAGREARYKFFEEIAEKHSFNKIATAHNANDQAETVLFRLIRGSGLEGLCGIKNYRDSKIIRPILCLCREEVEKYVESKELKPRIDKTNFERIYNRNKIRLDILPYIKENFNQNIIETLNRTALQLQKDNEFLEQETIKIYKKCCELKSEYFIIKKETFNNNEAIVTRVIRKSLMEYSEQNYDFEMKHIYEVLNLAQGNTGKSVNLPNNIIAENVYGDIVLKKVNLKKKLETMDDNIIIRKESIDKLSVEFNNYLLNFSVVKNNNKHNLNLQNNDFVRYFDFDKIRNEITIRTRKDGDKIKPIGMNCNKKVKDIFINIKVPKEIRNIIPIICFDENIAYIVGYKISEEYKVSKSSNNILKIEAKRKEL